MTRMLIVWLVGVLFVGAQETKIDPKVAQAIRGGRSTGVILLGTRQMLEGPKGFPDFCAQNKASKRTELRPKIIAQLKAIAKVEQAKLRAELDLPKEAQGLWLVNGIAATLTPEAIRRAAKSKNVKYIYPAGPIPMGRRRGRVSEVLPKVKRKAFSTKGKKIPWNLKAVGADKVWSELKIAGRGAVVAMFDSGVNYRHEDLRNNIWINPGEQANNGKDDDGNGLVDDYYGFNFRTMQPEVIATGPRQHGTLTSGIVAGDGTGGTVTGLAPEAELMLLMGWGGPYAAARVHEYALEMGADVMNMSFSIPNLGHTRGLWRLMSEHATAAGLVLVSGAGNFQREPKPVQLRIPEGIPCVIAAGGVDRNMKIPGFVSLGPVEWGSVQFYGDYPMPKGLIKPDVCGFPTGGYALLSSENKGYMNPNVRISGNSFSGPHVVGTVALMLSANPDLTAWRVKEIIEATAADLGPKGKDNDTGYGLLNALAAVKTALAEQAK
jgi:subtilisin family serine protease